MSETRRCSACGAELTEPTSLQGLCPACLLRLGLSDPAMSAVREPVVSVPETATVEAVHTASPPAPRRRYVPPVALAFVVLAVLGAGVSYFYVSRPGDEPSVVRFQLYPGGPERFGPSALAGDFALSPDGRLLAYVQRGENGVPVLWVHALDSFVDRPLEGTADATLPFWSPDSRAIGFFAHSKLGKIDVSYGGAQTLCDAPRARGGSWNHDRVILFAAGNLLYRVSANGGSPQAVTALDLSRREMSHGWPYFLPDGNHFLFTVAAATSEAAGIYIGSVDSKARTRILNNRSTAAYAANRNRGEVVFVRDNMLMALPFDAHRMAAAGEPQAVRYAENIEGNRGGAFSVSSTGVLAYRARENRSSRLVWMDRLGKILGMVGEPGEFHGFSLSPDGKFAAVSRGERNASADLWLLDLNRETLSRFTFDPAADFAPLWSPDGSRVVFLSNRNGRRGIYQKPVTGGTAEESLLHVPLHEIVSIDSWSADGRFISFTQRGDKGKTEIGILPVVRDRKPFPALQSDFDTKQGRISPDGRWIAYVSNESGRDEVFVQTFPGPGGKWQISNGGGDTPKWARNGRELFYISPDEMLMTVPVSANAGAFEPGIPGPLFRVAKQDYDVSQDSQRFMLAQPEGSSPSPIQVVIGWNHEH